MITVDAATWTGRGRYHAASWSFPLPQSFLIWARRRRLPVVLPVLHLEWGCDIWRNFSERSVRLYAGFKADAPEYETAWRWSWRGFVEPLEVTE